MSVIRVALVEVNQSEGLSIASFDMDAIGEYRRRETELTRSPRAVPAHRFQALICCTIRVLFAHCGEQAISYRSMLRLALVTIPTPACVFP